jgi:hypothetical protein
MKKKIIQLKKLLKINTSILNLSESKLSIEESNKIKKFKLKYYVSELDNFSSEKYLENTIQLGNEIIQILQLK